MILRENITKLNISKAISNETGLPLEFIKNFINLVFEELIIDLKETKVFKISKFGTFKIIFKKARPGRNPKNSISYEIDERNVISFKSSDYLRNSINK